MKTKTPKARVMWANPSDFTDISFLVDKRKSDAADWSDPNDPSPIRVAVIPLSDINALVERAEEAFLDHEGINSGRSYKERIQDALTAAGIPVKQRRARK